VSCSIWFTERVKFIYGVKSTFEMRIMEANLFKEIKDNF